jgi:hypothetical protein
VFKVVSIESELTVGPQEPFRPFSPVTLAPERPYMIRMTLRFQNCLPFGPDTHAIWDHVQVTYSALGRTRHQNVKLLFLLNVKLPAAPACPGHA